MMREHEKAPKTGQMQKERTEMKQTGEEPIRTLKQLEQKLQRAGRKQAKLYLFCNFTALMIVSAYAALMLSPTIQTVFPPGGDSRKQMDMIFVMTLAGCVVFTLYATGLFFRHKSRQLGILMALGASRKKLFPGLFREVFLLSSLSSAAGIIAGLPLVWMIWSAFRLFLVVSFDMALRFDWRYLFISLFFWLLVTGFTCLSAWRYVRRTNIMEVIREEHINEPVKELGKWCGPAGAALILIGAALGYGAPGFWLDVMNAYPPVWLAILYAPVFAGLYMVMLHTVVNGWENWPGTMKRKKNPYKNIISRSMMKFQGKQTVNNLIIVTLLVAGACFAIFYLPTMSSSAMLEYARRSFDYFYEYRPDQNIPDRDAVEALAEEHGLSLKDWETCEYITVGAGRNAMVEEADGKHFHIEYEPIGCEMTLLSEDAYARMTGETVDIAPGAYFAVTNQDETSVNTNESAGHLTNMTTRKQIETGFAGYLHDDMLVGIRMLAVVSDEDYALLAEDLSDEWRGVMVRFNADGKDSYEFAKDLYHRFVASFDEGCEISVHYDRVCKIMANEAGEAYWGDSDPFMEISYKEMESTNFKMGWRYQPKFRILDKNDFLVKMAVFFMMFLFIFIVCLTTALVVCYTRCQTIALNNRYIFDDLKKLGASPAFLEKEIRSQCGNVFRIPALVGMMAMYLYYGMILYVNDGQIALAEIIGMGVCMGVLFLIGFVFYFVYRAAVNSLKRQLQIG